MARTVGKYNIAFKLSLIGGGMPEFVVGSGKYSVRSSDAAAMRNHQHPTTDYSKRGKRRPGLGM